MPNVLRQNQLIALVRKGFLAAKYPEKHRAILMTDVALEAIQLKLDRLIQDAESSVVQDDELLRRQCEIYQELQNYAWSAVHTTSMYRVAKDEPFHQYAEVLHTKSFEALMNDYVVSFVRIYMALHKNATKTHATQAAIDAYNNAIAATDGVTPFSTILETELSCALSLDEVKKDVLSSATKRMFQLCLASLMYVAALGCLITTLVLIGLMSYAMLGIMLAVSIVSLTGAMIFLSIASEHHKKEVAIETQPLHPMDACQVSFNKSEQTQDVLFTQMSRTTFNLVHLKLIHTHLSAKIRRPRSSSSSFYADTSSSSSSYDDTASYVYDSTPSYDYSSNHYHSHDDSSSHYHSHDDFSSYHHGHG